MAVYDGPAGRAACCGTLIRSATGARALPATTSGARAARRRPRRTVPASDLARSPEPYVTPARPAAVGRAYHRAPMCEHYVARAAEPFRLDELWPFTERLERFGIAGFGWGAAWLGGDGAARVATATSGRSATTRGRETVGANETTERCSSTCAGRRKLSTLQLADTQPFDDPAGRFAFSHNGDLRDYERLRGAVPGTRAGSTAGPTPRSASAGSRTRGRRHEPGVHAARRAPRPFGGQANLARPRAPTGAVLHYAGNTENPVFAFRLGRIGHRVDRALLARPLAVPLVGARARPTAGSSARATRPLDRMGRPPRPDRDAQQSAGSTSYAGPEALGGAEVNGAA